MRYDAEHWLNIIEREYVRIRKSDYIYYSDEFVKFKSINNMIKKCGLLFTDSNNLFCSSNKVEIFPIDENIYIFINDKHEKVKPLMAIDDPLLLVPKIIPIYDSNDILINHLDLEFVEEPTPTIFIIEYTFAHPNKKLHIRRNLERHRNFLDPYAYQQVIIDEFSNYYFTAKLQE